MSVHLNKNVRLIALQTADGHPCVETVLANDDITYDNRKRVERIATSDTLADPPIPGTWTNVSGWLL